jgi:hypothetical protein
MANMFVSASRDFRIVGVILPKLLFQKNSFVDLSFPSPDQLRVASNLFTFLLRRARTA